MRYEGTKILRLALTLIPTLSPKFSFSEPSSSSTTFITGLVTLELGSLLERLFVLEAADAALCSKALTVDDTFLLGRGVPVGDIALDGSAALFALGVGVPPALMVESDEPGLVVGVGPTEASLLLADVLLAALLARVPLLSAEIGREMDADDNGRSMDCLRSWAFLKVVSESERTEDGLTRGVLLKICESRRFEGGLFG